MRHFIENTGHFRDVPAARSQAFCMAVANAERLHLRVSHSNSECNVIINHLHPFAERWQQPTPVLQGHLQVL